MSEQTPDTAIGLIDADLAVRTATRLLPSGPKVTKAEAARAVAELTAAAERAHGPVAETTRLQAPPSARPARIVDRRRWVEANAASFDGLLRPLAGQILERQRAGGRATPPAAVRKVSGAVTGTEMGTLLAFLSGKVLGQYDLAYGSDPDAASLMLVAPNILATERELLVDPTDFRLWVCLHEETHRVQFTAVPWLREHMLTASSELVRDMLPEPDQLAARIRAILPKGGGAGVRSALRSGGNGLADVFITDDQRERLAEITAVMALLEGHADVVMDEVGPQVVPSVATIRERFERRRDGMGSIDVIIRRLLGLEAKTAQYRDGAGFVRGVVERVGMDGFNAVWTSPQTLPTPAEINDPQAWVARVHG